MTAEPTPEQVQQERDGAFKVCDRCNRDRHAPDGEMLVTYLATALARVRIEAHAAGRDEALSEAWGKEREPLEREVDRLRSLLADQAKNFTHRSEVERLTNLVESERALRVVDHDMRQAAEREMVTQRRVIDELRADNDRLGRALARYSAGEANDEKRPSIPSSPSATAPDVPYGPGDICPYCGVAGPGVHCWSAHR